MHKDSFFICNVKMFPGNFPIFFELLPLFDIFFLGYQKASPTLDIDNIGSL